MSAPRVFFDTNVLLDVLLGRGPWFHEASLLCNMVDDRRVRGSASAISCNNMYYVLRRVLGRERALSSVLRLLEGLEVVALDRKVILAAAAVTMGDFEDAIQYVSARQAGADYLVTRDIRDFPQGTPEVLVPGDLLRILETD